MAASVGTGSSGGRRRSLDAEINLVPFIDLLSMCICFLLMTAVWLEIRALHIKQLVGTEAASEASAVYDLEVLMKPGARIELQVKKGSKVVKKFDVQPQERQQMTAALASTIQTILPALGVNSAGDVKLKVSELFAAARVTPDSEYTYGDLVAVMDVIRDWGLPHLGVVPRR